MRGLIGSHRGWVVFFGSVLSLLLLAVSALFTVDLVERDAALRQEQARAQEQSAQQSTPEAVMPEPGTDSGASVTDIAVDLDSQWLEEAAERTGIPPRVLRSYVGAAAWSAQRHRGCRLPWNTLAGIGSVESDHGRYQGAKVGEDGQLRGEILGAQLNGLHTARIPDTDGGEYDGDTEFDRAVGPMQFIPATWKQFAADGNGDGEFDPNNIDDATATAASYLCSGKRDLSDEQQWIAAILGYNPSEEYVALVAERATAVARSLEADDGGGASATPSATPSAGASDAPAAGPSGGASPGASGTPSPGTSGAAAEREGGGE